MRAQVGDKGFVIVKMDIEGAEYPVLRRLASRGASTYVCVCAHTYVFVCREMEKMNH